MQQEMTLEEARGYLARAVLTQGPEFVYMVRDEEGRNRGCSYFVGEGVSQDDPRRLTPCLIGVAIRLAGREVLPVHDGSTPTHGQLMEHWNLSWKAAAYFGTAQFHQDSGFTWGEAFAGAEKWAEAQSDS